MRRNLFWLSEERWARIEPHLPTDVRGVERVDDRRVISGIVRVLKRFAAGAIGRPSIRRRRSTTASCAGRVAGSGKPFPGVGAVRAIGGHADDPAHVKAYRAASGGKGEKKQAVGRSRGGRNTKSHALADAKGPKQRSDL